MSNDKLKMIIDYIISYVHFSLSESETSVNQLSWPTEDRGIWDETKTGKLWVALSKKFKICQRETGVNQLSWPTEGKKKNPERAELP